MGGVLDKISLCTYSSGQTMVREVLGDWLHFLGGRPNQVIFAVSSVTGLPSIYEELHQEGTIDRIIWLEARGRSVEAIDAEALPLVVGAAPTEWVLLFKLDTLPCRSGHEFWVTEAIETVERHGLFGMTGSSRIADLIPLEDGYCVSQKFSNNFSLFRKSDWLNVINGSFGHGSATELAERPQFHGENLRFINEYVIENHLEQTGKKMLVKNESLDWSVFHVNVWGEALRKVRRSYLERKGVKRFLNTGKPFRRILRYPWQKYYGYPPPPPIKHLRIVLGRWRRDLFGIRS
jgi:hypothetical protein